MTERAIARYHSAAAFVRDIEVSKRFYADVLQLAVESDFGKNVIMEGGVTLWEIDSNHIIAKRLGIDVIGDREINRFEFYFETEDIDAACERMRASGAEFLHSLHEEPWGQRTVRFFDPDRHLVEIGESMATFVKRLHAADLTVEEVSHKTSIPLERVRELLRE